MKTPIQEAIETIKEYRDNGYADVDTCNTILLKLASMLEKEKGVIEKLWNDSRINFVRASNGFDFYTSFEDYYNETFNTKE